MSENNDVEIGVEITLQSSLGRSRYPLPSSLLDSNEICTELIEHFLTARSENKLKLPTTPKGAFLELEHFEAQGKDGEKAYLKLVRFNGPKRSEILLTLLTHISSLEIIKGTQFELVIKKVEEEKKEEEEEDHGNQVEFEEANQGDMPVTNPPVPIVEEGEDNIRPPDVQNKQQLVQNPNSYTPVLERSHSSEVHWHLFEDGLKEGGFTEDEKQKLRDNERMARLNKKRPHLGLESSPSEIEFIEETKKGLEEMSKECEGFSPEVRAQLLKEAVQQWRKQKGQSTTQQNFDPLEGSTSSEIEFIEETKKTLEQMSLEMEGITPEFRESQLKEAILEERRRKKKQQGDTI